ncbi:TetR/AcrR family transcriptional regulator [Anaerosolibacter sp.]|uniref:TetR/AcrR family transcriptional regulator n=1 Tax=Anaerosolibacter sp. TaxID=1872527 RepID=UPI0039F1317A
MTDKTIDKIRDAALELFTKKGYCITSMKDIAKAAGITAPAIYVYYKSKEDLYLKVVDYCIDIYSQHLTENINQLQGIYDERQLFKFFKLRIQQLKENEMIHKFLMGMALFPLETCKEEIIGKYRNGSYVNIIKFNRMYMDLVDKELIKPIGVEMFVRSLHRFINGIVFDTIAFQYQLNEEVLETLWKQYWEGIKAN